MDGSFDNKADLIAEILRKEQLSAVTAIMVGDRAEDITAGLANDIQSVGVTCGFGTHDELSSAGANVIVSNLQELQDWLALSDQLRPSRFHFLSSPFQKKSHRDDTE